VTSQGGLLFEWSHIFNLTSNPVKQKSNVWIMQDHVQRITCDSLVLRNHRDCCTQPQQDRNHDHDYFSDLFSISLVECQTNRQHHCHYSSTKRSAKSRRSCSVAEAAGIALFALAPGRIRFDFPKMPMSCSSPCESKKNWAGSSARWQRYITLWQCRWIPLFSLLLLLGPRCFLYSHRQGQGKQVLTHKIWTW